MALPLLAAASAAADGCSNAQFRTGASAALPDCRAYEQVSAVEKFGNGVWSLPPTVGASQTGGMHGWARAGGGRLMFTTAQGAGAENAVRGAGYFPQVADRTDTRWTVRPAIDGPAPDAIPGAVLGVPRFVIPSAELDALLFTSGVRFADPQPNGPLLNGNGGVQRAAPDGKVTWISQPSWAGADLPPGTAGVEGIRFGAVGGSDDLSTVYFMTRQTLTAEDGASGRTWNQRWALYKVKDGVLSNAGVLPDGTVDPAGSVSAGVDASSDRLGTTGQTSNLSSALGNGHVVSRDGDRALFIGLGDRSVPGRVSQLYMHRDGQPSLLISKQPLDTGPIVGSTGIVPVNAFTPAHAQGASVEVGTGLAATGDRDLGVVLFATGDALVAGAPDDQTRVNTYRYDVEANQLEYLAELDRPRNALNSRSSIGNVYRMSDDGSRILFRTPAGEVKLWREGQSTLTLATGVAVIGTTSNGISGVRFSEDGKTVVFMSREPINGEVTHPPGGGVQTTQVYRFDEGVDAVPRCVSCPALDAAVKGPATFDMKAPMDNGFGNSQTDAVVVQPRGVSADGRRVFFTTSSTLSERDGNAVADVYEWSADRDGVELLSSGAPGSRGDALVDIDAAGKDVFFVTEARLTASDTDDVYDMYTVRLGGGLPDPPGFDRESGCALAACQGAPGAGFAAPFAGSASFAGRGNVPSRPDVSVGVARLKAVPGAVARVRVRVPGAGRISVAGALVRGSSRSASRAGSYTVQVRLGASAKQRLRRRGTLKVKVRVAYRSRDGRSAARTLSISFKQPKAKSKRAAKGGR